MKPQRNRKHKRNDHDARIMFMSAHKLANMIHMNIKTLSDALSTIENQNEMAEKIIESSPKEYLDETSKSCSVHSTRLVRTGKA